MKTLVRSLALGIPALAAPLLLVGCSGNFTGTPAPVSVHGTALSGRVYGGSQPISGAAIQLYAVSSSGYRSASLPLLTSPVSTATDGSFNIAGDYTCTGDPLVYIVASQGNPGLQSGSNNPYISLTAALGLCSSLNSGTKIFLNEMTTVASVYALAPFMADAAHVGAPSTNQTGMANAFAAVNELVNLSTGTTPGPALSAGSTLPPAPISTIAGILSSCVNSPGGSPGDGGNCDQLFAETTFQGVRPGDTVGAALSMAKHTTNNVPQLWALRPSQSPFQPTLAAAPSDWTLAIRHTGGGLNAPQGIAVDASGNLWLPNKGNNSVTELSPTGAPLSSSTGYTGLSTPSALAIDTAGNIWVANQGGGTGSGSLTQLSSSGTVVATYSGGGLNAPSSIAVDGAGIIWLANSGANTVSAFTGNGTPLSPNGFVGAGLSQPVSIAVDPQ